jgi:1-acyl-sn-glycerol-3-phosphate acyltransferase
LQLTSLVFLIAFAFIAVAYAAYALVGPGRYNWWERILYAPVYALARVLWRVEIEWHDNCGSDLGSSQRSSSLRDSRTSLLSDRLSTGALLIANHRCSLDPFFIQLISGKRVHWMVAGEYFRHFLFGPVLRSFQAIPTNRAGVDTASTKRAIALARSGRFVGMFPEGRINRSESPLLTIRPGAALVAMKANVPLVPIWIEGAPRCWEVYSALFIPAKVKIIVGSPNCFGHSGKNVTTDLEIDRATEIQPSFDANSSEHRKSNRSDAIDWIVSAMGDLLDLGGHSRDEVGLAGKKWLEE